MFRFVLELPVQFLTALRALTKAIGAQTEQTRRIADLLEAGAASGAELPDELGAQLDAATDALSASTESLQTAVDTAPKGDQG